LTRTGEINIMMSSGQVMYPTVASKSLRGVNRCCQLSVMGGGETPAIDWAALRPQIDGPQRLLASSWVAAWAQAYLPMRHWTDRSLYLVALNDLDEPSGVLPLTVQRLGVCEILSIGGLFVPFRSWPVASDREIRESASAVVAEELTRRCGRYLGVHLWPTYERDEGAAGLMRALRRNGWRVLARAHGPVLEWSLPAQVAEFERNRASHLKRIRYYQRRMAKLGNVEIRKHSAHDAEGWSAVIDDLATIERNSWVVKKNGDPKFCGRRNRRFWLAALHDEFLSVAANVWILYFDAKPVSFSFNFDVCRSKFILLNSYDDAVKEHSTGSILVAHIVRDAIERGVKLIDWGLGDSGYKQVWGARPSQREMEYFAVRPSIVAGVVARLLQSWRGFQLWQK
jgi:CelD/BcsL family acetyltransferase involved in cellulose biosynthesis